ncbi:MAG: glutamine--fructose-6-phosphate transaminase (isomerizing) [Holosporaceae bacterium]|nr:MAG: glutamine--fructose-6-phosphate transaminase (isomerizing) [Holosporaceae bacterium]
MCGIIGIISNQDTVSRLLSGLKSLEYRGYDSAGIAVINDRHIHLRRTVGKIDALVETVGAHPLSGSIGIGHSRWATHGGSTIQNAHPHITDQVAIVHNGIIENHRNIRLSLEKKGTSFSSETDSEVIVHLVTGYLNQGLDPEQAAFKTFEQLEGAYAVAVIFRDFDDLMICSRKGSPLTLGLGKAEMFIGSDALSLSPFTHDLVYLEEGDIAVLKRDSYKIYDQNKVLVERPVTKSQISGEGVSKGKYPHFMLKEIYEQPDVIRRIIQKYVKGGVPCVGLDIDWAAVDQVTFVACGTSFYAAQIAQNWFEGVAKMSTRVEVASEFRYRQPPLSNRGVTIVISQSGETADTLAALRYAKSEGQTVIALVNVVESTIARESDYVVPISAGPEIGVASTKAFTAQLLILIFICFDILRSKKKDFPDFAHILKALKVLPLAFEKLLLDRKLLQQISQKLAGNKSIIFLGRGAMFGVALEGALKLKELSYLHAEGAPSGELKHGPIALVDEHTPIIYLMPDDVLVEKNKSNLEEVMARKGQVYLIGGASASIYREKVVHFFEMPDLDAFCAPLLYTLPMQLIAYETALIEGSDVDQPRNLAKSVTVE